MDIYTHTYTHNTGQEHGAARPNAPLLHQRVAHPLAAELPAIRRRCMFVFAFFSLLPFFMWLIHEAQRPNGRKQYREESMHRIGNGACVCVWRVHDWCERVSLFHQRVAHPLAAELPAIRCRCMLHAFPLLANVGVWVAGCVCGCVYAYGGISSRTCVRAWVGCVGVCVCTRADRISLSVFCRSQTANESPASV